MKTKTRQATRRDVLRALARLTAQARLNVGDSDRLGRGGEAAAWSVVGAFLEATCESVRAGQPLYHQGKLALGENEP